MLRKDLAYLAHLQSGFQAQKTTLQHAKKDCVFSPLVKVEEDSSYVKRIPPPPLPGHRGMDVEVALLLQQVVDLSERVDRDPPVRARAEVGRPRAHLPEPEAGGRRRRRRRGRSEQAVGEGQGHHLAAKGIDSDDVALTLSAFFIFVSCFVSQVSFYPTAPTVSTKDDERNYVDVTRTGPFAVSTRRVTGVFP